MSTIDPTIKTSQVFAATLAVFDRLSEVSLPTHPTTNNQVAVFLFRDPGWEDNEYVVVATNEDPASNEWIQSGPASAEEQIVVDVVIYTMFPETDPDDPNDAVRRVIVRLRDIAEAVQSIAWDMATMKPKPFGFPNERTIGRRIDVSFRCGHTTEGVVGTALVRFGLVAQI